MRGFMTSYSNINPELFGIRQKVVIQSVGKYRIVKQNCITADKNLLPETIII